MNFQAFFALSIVAVSGVVFAAPAASVPAHDGLVPVESRQLDQLRLRPDADLGGYRRIMIDPVQVEFRDDWLKNINYYTRNPSRWLGKDDARRIAEDAAAGLRDSVAEAFKARGYEIVGAPESGVLRLTPSATDLDVYAPDRLSPWRTRTFTRDAGQATLLLEARDAVSGTLLGRVVHRGRAQQMGRLERATDVSNRFWFDALFGRWAANCVAAFEASGSRPGRSAEPATGR